MSATYLSVPLAQIEISSTNPRRTYDKDKLKELAENIGRVGVLQPVLCRKKEGGEEGYELIFGTRRFKAAKLAKLEEIPIRLVHMDDREVIEAQVIENAQREDVHPLEEAEGYESLAHPPKSATYAALTVDEIAAKVGKSRSWVYARMKLLALTKENRERFYGGELDASRAMLLARIPDPKLQNQAGKEITAATEWVHGEGNNREPMSYRSALGHVQRRYMLRLAEAPFPVSDALLVAKAGACTVCPKRTGNQAELFSDVKSADVCTDPPCYEGKVLAMGEKKIAEAKAAGRTVLEGKAAAQALAGNGYAEANQKHYEDRQNRTTRQLVGKEGMAQAVVTVDKEGQVHELVPVKLLNQAKKAKGVGSSSSHNGYAEERKRTEERKTQKNDEGIRQTAARAALLEVVDHVATKGANVDAVLRALCPIIAWDHGGDDWYTRRGFKKRSSSDMKKIAGEIAAKLKGAELLSFLVELSTEDLPDMVYRAFDPHLVTLCAAAGVDLQGHEDSIRQSAEEGVVAEKEAAAAKKATKKAKGGKAAAEARA